MNGSDLLRIIDQMHREKNIPKEVIFQGIEAALQLATEKHYGDEEGITVTIDRDSGVIQAHKGEDVIVPATVSKTDLRIQKVRASMKQPLAYVVAEAPVIAALALKGVAGFSGMIELPRPEGPIQGAIPADIDGDGVGEPAAVNRPALKPGDRGPHIRGRDAGRLDDHLGGNPVAGEYRLSVL